MAKKCPVRSNSFPSASHPTTVRVEEQLRNFKNFEATTSTSTSESVSNGLSFLQDLYICLDDLLNLASTQKLISHHKGEKCVEEILDGSVRLLDICSITRDTLSQIKEDVQALHSAIRRRKGDSSIERCVEEYNLLTKKVKKNAKKFISSLKEMDRNFGVSPLLNQDQDDTALIKVLREIIAMNMPVFQSLLSFLAFPSSKSKVSIMVAKLMHKGVYSSDEENSNELKCVHAALSTLLSDCSDVEKKLAAREKIDALENAIESIEDGLESVFRHLIKTRASLLNIMTQ